MKNNRSKISVWLGALSLMVLAIGSCSKNPLLPSEQPNKEYMDLYLELIPPGAFTAATKTMSNVEQNAIDNAEVLVFKDNILLYHESGIVTNSANSITKGVNVTLKPSQNGEMFDIMVIGNWPEFNFEDYVGHSKDELKADFAIPIEGKWVGKKFVMYGEALQKLITPQTNNFKIQMLRSLARVDVGMGVYKANGTWAGLKDVFSLTEVRVFNSRNKFAVIPTETTLNMSGNVIVSKPTILPGFDAQGVIEYSSPTEIINNTYTKSTIFIAEAPNDKDMVTILIGGSYKGGTTTYYRVDMNGTKADEQGSFYLNILRNHLYRISITNITGAGFSTPDEALAAPPLNIVTILSPIVEGGAGGDVIFDGNSYLMTNVSNVVIYGKPNGEKSYKIATVKATFAAGIPATISGPGIPTPINLISDNSIEISYAIPETIKSGSYKIKVGQMEKTINFSVQSPIDAHYDFLPFVNVSTITVDEPKPWLKLSRSIKFNKYTETLHISSNREGKAYLHFDENIVYNGEAPRMARVYVKRNNSNETTGVVLEQLNLSGMVLGELGGDLIIDYTKRQDLIAIEAVEEYLERVYEDTSIKTDFKLPWGYFGQSTNVGKENVYKDKQLGGQTLTALLYYSKEKNFVDPPYTIYSNYAAGYCVDKNRDLNGNGDIDSDEIKWYVPSLKQLMLAWIAHRALTVPFREEASYWSSSVYDSEKAMYAAFSIGFTSEGSKRPNIFVRCARDLTPQAGQ